MNAHHARYPGVASDVHRRQIVATAPLFVRASARSNAMVERLRLPVLPMRETVIFPGVAVPITAGRPGTLEAIEKVLEDDRRLFAVCQRENVDDATPEVLYEYGVIVRVMQVQRTPAGLQLLIQGERRAKSL